MLLATFAGLSLVLAAIGLYGVMAYHVSQRRHEIGIRLALGADERGIIRMMVGGALRLTLTGLAIGVALALALSRSLTALLYQTPPTDPLTLAGVVLLLGAVALTASYLPARRATRVDPLSILRSE